MDVDLEDPPRVMPEAFDLIIVGAGSAGSLLTMRLASSTAFEAKTILILEAGKERSVDPKIDTPARSGQLLGDPDYDWDFKTEPESGLDGRRIKHPRGRVVGGTSAINSHSVVFPSRYYHDFWHENLLSEPGHQSTDETKVDWSWEGVSECYARPFAVQAPSREAQDKLGICYKKCSSTDSAESPAVEGSLDRIQTSFPSVVFPLQQYWIETYREADFLSTSFGMDGRAFGGFTALNAVDTRPNTGTRSYTGHFWKPLKRCKNVFIMRDATVERIVFAERAQGSTGRLQACGVRIFHKGQSETMHLQSGGEVVLSAGVFGSPQILEHSGIGPRTVLEDARIHCLYDLRGVGENLQDHLNCGCSVEVTNDVSTRDAEWLDPAFSKQIADQYDADRTGPLANGWAYSYSHVPSQWLSPQTEQDNLQAALVEALDSDKQLSKGLRSQYQFLKSVIESPTEATATMVLIPSQRNPDLDLLPADAPRRVPGNFVTVFSQLSHPFSRGSCHVTSSEASRKPLLKFNYLSHSMDRQLFRTHLRQIERFLQLPPLSQVVKSRGTRLPRTNAGKFTELDDEKLDDIMKKTVATNYHPCGTCAMMAESFDGVVDERFKVYGTANVRVVDSSIFPIVPRGNILTTVYAVAEKAAKVILADLTL